MPARWDTDERGRGVASAEAAVPDLDPYVTRCSSPTQRSPGVGRDVELFVTTGMLEGDGSFAPHGQTVQVRVRRAESA